MLRRRKAVFLVGVSVLASLMVLALLFVQTFAIVYRLYSVKTVVTKGIEVTSHTLSHASDGGWYQINSQKAGAWYIIDVTMFYYTTVNAATLTKIYVLSEAHIGTATYPVAINIYNYQTLLWEPAFNVAATADAAYNRTITANPTHYVTAYNLTHYEMKLQVYYKIKDVAQIIYQDHTYIELTSMIPPVADFTWTPEPAWKGETVTFNATDSYDPDGYIAWYFWNFGDSTPPVNTTDPITTHIYADYGNYTVTLTVSDNDDLTATKIKTVRVYPRSPFADFTYSPSSPLVGETVTFNATDSYDPDGSIVNYTWDFGDSTPVVTEADPIITHIYTQIKTYNVTLTITDSEGLTDTTWTLVNVSGIHDVAVTNVTPSKTVVGQGFTLQINVTVANQGNYTENFNVTVYYQNATGDYTIGTRSVTLAAGAKITLTFIWNTTGVMKETYKIKAVASIVSWEADLADNTYVDGTLIVTTPGDATGDGYVDIYDLTKLALSWLKKIGDPKYNPNVDFDGDGIVDIYDLTKLAINWHPREYKD